MYQKTIKAFCLFALAAPFALFSQSLPEKNSATLKKDIQKLGVLGSVLYLAAHPDDENTRFISYLANQRLVQSSYLSLTRGDGGQNLIGKELGEELGLIRTYELLAARRTDGGQQFFTRANDFGFSKSYQESLLKWGEAEVFADVIWNIRKLKPDVIVTRFALPGKNIDTHGHHTASAYLAAKAFKAAADPSVFPEQLKYVAVWQAKRIVWNTSPFFFADGKMNKDSLLQLEVGAFDPILGKSYHDLAMESRSQHKSQGFGAGKTKGSQTEYFDHIDGAKAQTDILEGVDMGWSRAKGSKKLLKLLDKAYRQFDAAAPKSSLPVLLELYDEMLLLEDSYWKTIKIKELSGIIRDCGGLWYETTAKKALNAAGDSLYFTLSVIDRTGAGFQLAKAESALAGVLETKGKDLPTNILQKTDVKMLLPQDAKPGMNYWLDKPKQGEMFDVPQELRGLPYYFEGTDTRLTFEIQGRKIVFDTPLLYKWTHRVDGERYRQALIAPAVAVNWDGGAVQVFTDNSPKKIALKIKAFRPGIAETLAFDLPKGWRAEPAEIPFKIAKADEEVMVEVVFYAPQEPSEGRVKVLVGGRPAFSYATIDYLHLPVLTRFKPSESRVVKLDLQKKGVRVAFIPGAGDQIPEALVQMGYKVDVLEDNALETADLSVYDAVVTGIRAYNINPRLKHLQGKLLSYTEKGGTLIIQYNVDFGLQTKELGPFPFALSNDRITVEDAPVEMLLPDHGVWNLPNKITSADFGGWVQERGLYFPNSWDERYQPLLSSSDPGGKSLKGALLYAPYGQGHFFYTGISFFRELPAGVPGAFRIFANMVSYGKK